jgi:TPR repeat protein
MVRSVITDLNARDYLGLEGKVKETREKAEKGDVFSEMLYGMFLAGLPQLNATYDKAVPWFLKAAQAGAPYAQYQIGANLLQGRGCVCDINKGEVWLEKAAQADEPSAQVTLAEFLLSDPTKKDSSGAHDWLERAAKRGSSDGEFMLAALLATDPSQGVRDPHRALELTKKIEKKFREDPLYWEILAAANAGVGDFSAAGSAEDKALAKAAKLGWDVAPMQARRETYRGKQTWQGNLLAF